MSTLDLQFGNVLKSVLGENGIDDDRLSGDLAERFRGAYDEVEARRATGQMGLFDLPYATETIAQTVELADGSLLSVWYERMKSSPLAVLRQARWSIV